MVSSLLMQERGLKFSPGATSVKVAYVAPYAGAWIEILISLSLAFILKSLLMQERGLKYRIPYFYSNKQLSLLMQERGLK